MSEAKPQRPQYGGSRHRREVSCVFCRKQFSITEHREHSPACSGRPPECAKPGYRKGTKFTEEHKQKIAQALRGRKGRPWTVEEKAQISERLKGNTYGCGYKWTDAQKAKIKGRPSWCKGLKMSAEFRRRVSEAQLRRFAKNKSPKAVHVSPLSVVHEPPIYTAASNCECAVETVMPPCAAASPIPIKPPRRAKTPRPPKDPKLRSISKPATPRMDPEELHRRRSENARKLNAARWGEPGSLARQAQSERLKGNEYNLGKTKSEESRRKLSASLKGRSAWHAGKTLSAEHKAKIGAARVGKKRPEFSEEWRRNIGRAHIGVNRGERSASWKGGITALRKQIRDSHKTREWRTAVFRRDDFTCQHCQQRGGELQADHHPRTFEHIIRENQIKTLDDAHACPELWDTNNGRTLCVACHRSTDTWGGRGREKAA